MLPMVSLGPNSWKGLLVPLHGPIKFTTAESCRLLILNPLHFWEVLPICKDGPFPGDAANVKGWAHFREVLPMSKNRPITPPKAAANCFTWAHCFSRKCNGPK